MNIFLRLIVTFCLFYPAAGVVHRDHSDMNTCQRSVARGSHVALKTRLCTIKLKTPFMMFPGVSFYCIRSFSKSKTQTRDEAEKMFVIQYNDAQEAKGRGFRYNTVLF